MTAHIVDIKLDDFIGEDQCRRQRERGKYIWGKTGLLIGRDASVCDLPIDCEFVSRKHARITYIGSDFFLEDTESTDGTKLNGGAVDSKRKYSLIDTDEIQVGDRIIRLQIPNFGDHLDAPAEKMVEEVPSTPKSSPIDDLDDLEDFLERKNSSKSKQSHPVDELSKEASRDTGFTKESAPRPEDIADIQYEENAQIETIVIPATQVEALIEKDTARTLVEALKIDPEPILAGIKDEDAFVRSLGALLFCAIDGIRKALLTQDRFMDQYRIPGTVLGRSTVNPLYNHNIETVDAIEILLTNSSEAISDPISAVTEATRDFYRHGIAVPRGVDAAIKRIMQTFDWRQIEDRVSASGGLIGVGLIKKSSNWDSFCREYDRQLATLDEFDNEFRRAVGAAYSEARNQVGQQEIQGE